MTRNREALQILTFRGNEAETVRTFPEYNQAHIRRNDGSGDETETDVETDAGAGADTDLSLIGKFLDNHWTSPARAHTEQRSKYVDKMEEKVKTKVQASTHTALHEKWPVL